MKRNMLNNSSSRENPFGFTSLAVMAIIVAVILSNTYSCYASSVTELVTRKIYFTDARNGTVNRANLDGTGLEVLVASGQNFPTNLAIDAMSGYLYWSDGSLGRKVVRSDLDGSNVQTLVTVPSLSAPVTGVALDLLHGYMYYSAASSQTGIRRLALDGLSSDEQILNVDSVTDMEIDPVEGKIYFGDYDTNTIRVANLDGTNLQTLIPGAGHAAGIDLDIGAGKIYWTLNADHKIQRANLDGSNVETILSLTNEDVPQDIAVDRRNGHIYWTDPNRDIVQRAGLDGSNPAILVTGLGSPVGIVLGPSVAIPEPSALALLCLGSVCLAWRR